MKLIMLGPPGVGKGTIAKKITKRYAIVQISTGDLLRQAVKEGTGLGLKAKSYMDSGELVPDRLVLDLLKERISHDDCRDGYILDGFPRNTDQATALEEQGVTVDKVLNMHASDDTVVERISSRRVCSSCGMIYNLIFLKPEKEGTCDRCGGELYQRDDDKEEAVRKRLEVYREQTEPLIEFYRSKGMLHDIDAEPPIEEVFNQAVAILESSD